MKAGQMRNVAKVYAPSVTTDETGQETYTYKFYKTIYVGLVRDRYSKDETGFIQASGHDEYQLVTRYDASIGYNHQIEFNGQMLRITEVDDVMNLHHELRLRVTGVDK